jgi:hypothetical protein
LTAFFGSGTIIFIVNLENLILFDNSYQEWLRDVPDDARQPSMQIDMVPIHTKPGKGFERWEKGLVYLCLSACAERLFIFLR